MFRIRNCTKLGPSIQTCQLWLDICGVAVTKVKALFHFTPVYQTCIQYKSGQVVIMYPMRNSLLYSSPVHLQCLHRAEYGKPVYLQLFVHREKHVCLDSHLCSSYSSCFGSLRDPCRGKLEQARCVPVSPSEESSRWRRNRQSWPAF